jgi:hypothetical protein
MPRYQWIYAMDTRFRDTFWIFFHTRQTMALQSCECKMPFFYQSFKALSLKLARMGAITPVERTDTIRRSPLFSQTANSRAT